MCINTYLHRFHVQHLCDATLHNQKVRIVHVHLNGTKEISHFFIHYRTSVDEIFVFTAANTYLPRYGDFFAIFISNWTIVRICVIKYNRYRCLCYTRLTIFEDQLLQ